MIPFKKKPNSIVKNTAVLLILLCIFGASFGFIDDSRRTIEDSRVSPNEYDRQVSAKDESDRISVNLERKSAAASPYIRDVRADSRQSRIDARDIRTDFREIRTELREASGRRRESINLRQPREIPQDRSRTTQCDSQRLQEHREDSERISREAFRTSQQADDRRRVSDNARERTAREHERQNVRASRETRSNEDLRVRNVRDLRNLRNRINLPGASRQDDSVRQPDVLRDSNNNIRSRQTTRNIRDNSNDRRSGRNIENSRNSPLRTDERRDEIRNMRRQTVRDSIDRTSAPRTHTRREERQDVRTESRNSRDALKSFNVRREESRVSQRERDARREDQPRLLEERRSNNVRRAESSRFGREEERRNFNNERARDAPSRINKERREISRDPTTRVLQRDLLQQDRSDQPRQLDRQNNLERLENFLIARRNQQSNDRSREDLSRTNRDSRDRLLERSRNFKSRSEALSERRNNVQRSEYAGELRSRETRRLKDLDLTRTHQRRNEASGRERKSTNLRQKREISEDRSRTNQEQSRRLQEHREDSEITSRGRQIEAFRTSQQTDERKRVADSTRARMAREQYKGENVRATRQTRRNGDMERRERIISEVRGEIRESRKAGIKTDADFQRELRNLEFRNTRTVDSRNVEFIPNFAAKSSMLMNTLQVIIGAVLLGQIFLTPKNKIGFASVQNLWGKEKIY